MKSALSSVNDSTFISRVVNAPKPSVVMFHAPWCHQCPKMDKILSELSTSDLGNKADFYSMDVEDNYNIASLMKIMAVPTVMIFKGGQLADVITGVTQKSTTKEIIERAI